LLYSPLFFGSHMQQPLKPCKSPYNSSCTC
jgi:hypothetical protein